MTFYKAKEKIQNLSLTRGEDFDSFYHFLMEAIGTVFFLYLEIFFSFSADDLIGKAESS